MTNRFSVVFSLILTFMFTSVFAVNVTLNLDMENVKEMVGRSVKMLGNLLAYV